MLCWGLRSSGSNSGRRRPSSVHFRQQRLAATEPSDPILPLQLETIARSTPHQIYQLKGGDYLSAVEE
jgi:hypothetical protein